jgi:predicted dehydrogenase
MSSPEPIGIGVLSFAHGHAGVYCQVVQSFPDVRLVACWDDDAGRGRAAAERFGMEFRPRLDDLLADDAVHAVIVTNETAYHAQAVEAVAAAGKAILLQKPMALTLADCDRIRAAVEPAGVPFSMAFQMRHDPANLAMRRMLQDGTLGKVGILRRRHCLGLLFSSAFVTGPSRWHLDPHLNMGMFMDDAVHAADFLRWMLGEPVSVTAEIDNILTDVAPDDTGVALYRFESGTLGILFNSSVVLAAENTTEIYGDRGVLVHNWGDAPSTPMAPPGAAPLKLFRRDAQPPSWEEFPIPVPKSHGERIAAVPRPFIDYLKRGGDPPASLLDGRRSVEMILGAYQSAREGRRIRLPLG